MMMMTSTEFEIMIVLNTALEASLAVMHFLNLMKNIRNKSWAQQNVQVHFLCILGGSDAGGSGWLAYIKIYIFSCKSPVLTIVDIFKINRFSLFSTFETAFSFHQHQDIKSNCSPQTTDSTPSSETSAKTYHSSANLNRNTMSSSPTTIQQVYEQIDKQSCEERIMSVYRFLVVDFLPLESFTAIPKC